MLPGYAHPETLTSFQGFYYCILYLYLYSVGIFYNITKTPIRRKQCAFYQICNTNASQLKADPDPHGSGTYTWIGNYSSGSGSSKK